MNEELKKEAREFWKNVRKTKSCWLWQGHIKPNGYGRFGRVYAHHFAYELSKGEARHDMWVLHHCDVKRCVNPDHLYLGTATDNARDASHRQRWAYGKRNGMHRVRDQYRGENNSNAKLTNELVMTIRELADGGVSGLKIASMFGVGKTTVYEIINNQAWQNV